jgi:hypothetical protein
MWDVAIVEDEYLLMQAITQIKCHFLNTQQYLPSGTLNS